MLRFASQSNTNVLVNKYLGSVSTIDGAGSYLGMELRADLAEDFRSATAQRNPGLQFSLPARQAEALRTSEEYVTLTQRINDINTAIESSYSVEEQKQLHLLRKDAYKKRSSLENRRLREYQAAQRITYDVNEEDHQQCDWRQSHFDRIRHVLPEERVRLAKSLQERALPRSPEWVTALQDLISLRLNDRPVAYQKALQPLQGCCPVVTCGADLSR